MAIRTFVDSKGNTWEWEETPETVKAIEVYWNTVENNSKNQDT